MTVSKDPSTAIPKKHAPTVLITGCSPQSIGSSLAVAFVRRGYHVHATARTLSKLTHLTDLYPDRITAHECDVRSLESIAALRARITHLDILFNNAGISPIMPLLDHTPEVFRSTFETNTFAIQFLTQAFIDLLITSKGTIVNHTSVQAYVNSVYCGAYGASKAATRALTDVQRIELNPLGIRVVELVTGIVSSNITVNQMPQLQFEGNEDSYYWLIRDEQVQKSQAKEWISAQMDSDVYAEEVLNKLFDRGGSRVWIWSGGRIWTSYIMWLVGVVWKSVFDSTYIRMTNLGLLAERRKVMEEGKKGT